MTKCRMFLFSALAVVLACGICVQQGLAQENDLQVGTGQLSTSSVGALTLGSDASAAGLFQGIVAMGPESADGRRLALLCRRQRHGLRRYTCRRPCGRRASASLGPLQRQRPDLLHV